MKTRRSNHPRQRVDGRGKVVISRLSLHEQVADELRQMIIFGELAPGEKIKVSALAAQLDVSLTPLREALKVLDKESLVELTANRGARVTEISVDSTRSLFEVVSSLEALAAKLAATRITEEELDVLDHLHARMKVCHEEGDMAAYFNLNREIHDLVVEAAKNTDLTRVRTSLSFQVDRARALSSITPEHRDLSIEDHEALMEALRQRDPVAAQTIWQLHLERAGNEFCRIVALWNENTAPVTVAKKGRTKRPASSLG